MNGVLHKIKTQSFAILRTVKYFLEISIEHILDLSTSKKKYSFLPVTAMYFEIRLVCRGHHTKTVFRALKFYHFAAKHVASARGPAEFSKHPS